METPAPLLEYCESRGYPAELAHHAFAAIEAAARSDYLNVWRHEQAVGFTSPERLALVSIWAGYAAWITARYGMAEAVLASAMEEAGNDQLCTGTLAAIRFFTGTLRQDGEAAALAWHGMDSPLVSPGDRGAFLLTLVDLAGHAHRIHLAAQQ